MYRVRESNGHFVVIYELEKKESCLLIECYRECVSYLIAELGGGAEWNVASVCVPPLLMHMVTPSTHRNVVKGNTFNLTCLC